MNPITEHDIRTSFINCSKGEARRLNLPRDLAASPWPDLDFLGWRDPGAPERAYLVAERDGGLVGIALRLSQDVRRSFTKSTLCSVCVTPHSGAGVALFTAPRVGAAGRQGNTVGLYMCADLACSLYVRGRKQTELGERFESLTVEERVLRAVTNLDAFLDRVREDNAAPTA
ncbi:FBP domain-containing protein [Nonomuraea jiangxiensis]|uniref:FBP C-terminal treble-clef zinc-finger n=1 Tax=Nonomuraea jiangxiensis TaxID=633440 RepID=A0A1G9AN17_9ACTN|nr:FBP domain-containing protein [Nonomuraea jiangxiensis]SDK28722.1 FBP C-terminal treble-clef zinc-finger [Nonomuraea jiangxiensis]